VLTCVSSGSGLYNAGNWCLTVRPRAPPGSQEDAMQQFRFGLPRVL